MAGLFAWCIIPSQLLVSFWTHLKSIVFLKCPQWGAMLGQTHNRLGLQNLCKVLKIYWSWSLLRPWNFGLVSTPHLALTHNYHPLYLEQGTLRLTLCCMQSLRVQSLMSSLTWLVVEYSWKALSVTEVDWTLRVSHSFAVCSRYTSFLWVRSVPGIMLRYLTGTNLLSYANLDNFHY